MKNKKRTVKCILSIILLLAVLAGSDVIESKEAVKVASIKVRNVEKKLQLQKGEKFTLLINTRVSPNKSRYKKVKFTSSNKNVVSVSSKGVLTGKKAGKAKITITSVTKLKKKTSIIVEVVNKDKPSYPKEGINLQIGDQIFRVILYDNPSTQELKKRLPFTITMEELNGNEKYYYFPDGLPTDRLSVDIIHTGELMLYGSDCLVLFYKTFPTSYYYTRLGYIEDISGLSKALGQGSVTITFS